MATVAVAVCLIGALNAGVVMRRREWLSGRERVADVPRHRTAGAVVTALLDPARKLLDRGLRGIERMVEDDRYCIDILTQISAVNTALESLAFKILDEHVRHCVAGALSSGDQADAQTKTEELLGAVHRFARTR